MGMRGQFAISSRIFREGLNEKVRIEKTSERGQGRKRGLHSVGRAHALSRVCYCICMIYVDHWVCHYIFMS